MQDIYFIYFKLFIFVLQCVFSVSVINCTGRFGISTLKLLFRFCKFFQSGSSGNLSHSTYFHLTPFNFDICITLIFFSSYSKVILYL